MQKMVERVVIDSNMLETEALRAFFLESSTHVAVLPDYLWVEIYKQQSVEALKSAFVVIRDFPDRLVGLRAAGELAILDPTSPDLVEQMLYADVPDRMRMTFEAVALAEQGEPHVMTQLSAHWASASAHMEKGLEGAFDIIQSLPEIGEIFTVEETRRCRTDGKYTPDMLQKIFGAADQLYEVFLTGHKVTQGHSSQEHYYDAFLYRQALGIMIYSLWWIRKGSQLPKRLDRARNDMIDLHFAVYATYFDGFLTNDIKAHWVYSNLFGALKAVGAHQGAFSLGADNARSDVAFIEP